MLYVTFLYGCYVDGYTVLGGRALGLFVGVLFVFLIHLQVALKYDVDLIFSPLFLSTAHFVILPSILFAIALAPLLVSLWGISHEGAFGFSLGVAILLFPVIYKITMNFKAHVLIPIKERIYSIIYRIKFKLSVYPPYVYIADALLKTLCKMGIIQTPYWVIEISFENNVLKLLNATRKEQDSFRNILAEVFKKTKNEPKYILKLTKQKDKNILPPYILKREDAEFFAKQLEKKFGKIEVVGVRSLMGKRELLKARYNDFVRAKAKNQRTWGV